MPCKETQGFPVARRLLQRVEFDAVMAGQGRPNKWFVIYQRPNGKQVSRLGIVASKRVMPTAVARNLAKRVVREMFRLTFPPGLGIDLVVRVRRPVQRELLPECQSALMKSFLAIQEQYECAGCCSN